MANAGLQNELESYYLDMQKQLPASNVPAKALVIQTAEKKVVR